MSFQKLMIQGNIGAEPTLRYTPGGQAVLSFSVAVDRGYTKSDGTKVKETAWFKISSWGKQAETCANFLHKGDKSVTVIGRLNHDDKGNPKTFTRTDGTTGTSFEVTAEEIYFGQKANGNADQAEPAPVAEEEIPF